LVSLEAYNGGASGVTVTLSCANQATKTFNIPPGQAAVLTTGWTGGCASVDIASSNGWETNFDNLVIGPP
jgi:hypothetical protein